jgi:NitT/TauT family transport system permease protein
VKNLGRWIAALPSAALSAAAIAALLLIWTCITNMGIVSPTYLPSPQALAGSAWDLVQHGYQRTPLWQHIGMSLFRALAGFFLGILVGIPLGLVSGYSRLADAAISPIMAFVRPIPPIAFIPMVVLYFGLGELGKVVLIFFTALEYAQVNAHSGAMHVPIAYVRAAQSIGLTKRQIFLRIVFPSALPQIFTGLKVAMALSWAVVVAAELVGAQRGLGFMISDAAQLFFIPTVFIGIALIGVIGLILNAMIVGLETRIVHWKGR